MIIDNLVPFSVLENQALFTSHDSQVEVSLIEKAYAKLLGGYHQIAKKSIRDILIDLTNLPVTLFDLSFTNDHSDYQLLLR